LGKSLSLDDGKLSLAFDTVWLPEVGVDSTLTGWQVSPGSNNPSSLG